MKIVKDVSEFQVLGESWGGMVPKSLAAVIARVSRQRMDVLINDSKIQSCCYLGWKFVGMNPLRAWIRCRNARCNQATIEGIKTV